ncbi:hypothetical protein ACUY3K_04400 [Corynebacterium uberis]|uniref:hypothetical protein n=1 Tax=Corynebacterium TaxID=1716 RepID=UPI001D0AC393|nr:MULTISPECIES: hypothetical protein [Corynebacterium]MCZ9308336.1 hypothetical protein [Corynebacterium sp. c6VSa_13]UDL74009.1 hypothetical protein LH391_01930 [Corynebacterium uberis]UDL75107.1 hypothetical protein LH393_07480 [Corynebacterium uberis]UDL77320.1 hypothetical protein LH394_07465 [Corynebacterium uberis]UDL79604.1 hypothetical protein LH392_07885 [Corynebacterium uberis]
MKLTRFTAAAVASTALALGMVACSGDGSSDSSETATSSADSKAPTSAAAAAALPAAAELNDILTIASDPNRPLEEKLATVQGGETAPELFEVMAHSKQESGADFHVVDPVLPDMVPNSVLTTIIFTRPDQPDQQADNVRFVFEDNRWKLSKDWACTLVSQVVPDQLPQMCAEVPGIVPPAPAPAGGPEEPAPGAPEGAPGAAVPPAGGENAPAGDLPPVGEVVPAPAPLDDAPAQ